MATWAKKLKEHGESKRKAVPKVVRKPRGPLQETWAQIRPSNGSDPGAVIPAFYVVEDGVLTATDETGKPLEGLKPHKLCDGEDPQRVARRLALAHRKESGSDFNRPLTYPPLGIA